LIIQGPSGLSPSSLFLASARHMDGKNAVFLSGAQEDSDGEQAQVLDVYCAIAI